MKRGELLVLVLILALAAGMRLYHLESVPGLHVQEAVRGLAVTAQQTPHSILSALQEWSVRIFGTTAAAMRYPSAMVGVLTVLGVFLLARRLYDSRDLAAIAAFFTAIGFWHIALSRVGLEAVMPAFWATWGFYYLYKGIETHRIWHWGLAGLLFGLGMQSAPFYWTVIAAAIVTLSAWWWSLHTAFKHDKFIHARHQALGGVAAMVGVLILTLLPAIAQQPALPTDVPLAGQPLFFWAVSALMVAGILHTIWRVGHSIRTRNHPGVPHVMLLAWLGFAFAAHSMSIALPAAYLFAAVGLHWLAVWMRKWYAMRDNHQICLPFERFAGRHCVGEGTLVVSIAISAFLLATGVVEGQRYFQDWSSSARIHAEFPTDSGTAALRLNALPPSTLKYVVSNEPQAVQYLTNTGSPEAQEAVHLTYLTPEQFARVRLRGGSVIIHLNK